MNERERAALEAEYGLTKMLLKVPNMYPEEEKLIKQALDIVRKYTE